MTGTEGQGQIDRDGGTGMGEREERARNGPGGIETGAEGHSGGQREDDKEARTGAGTRSETDLGQRKMDRDRYRGKGRRTDIGTGTDGLEQGKRQRNSDRGQG